MRGIYLRSAERLAAPSGWVPEARDLHFYLKSILSHSNSTAVSNL
jgi:hypothetical protein